MKPVDCTVDFIIQFPTGEYKCKSKTNKRYRNNHLNAYSYDTRAAAQLAAKVFSNTTRGELKLIKRICNLEEC